MSKVDRKYDLEERLIEFSVSIIEVLKYLPKSNVGFTLSNQLIRSGTSLSLNYGEAQAAESRRDFIHKMKISLKEMRETYVCLKIIKKSGIVSSRLLDNALDENNQLISIFVKSLETVKSRQ